MPRRVARESRLTDLDRKLKPWGIKNVLIFNIENENTTTQNNKQQVKLEKHKNCQK